MFLVNNRCRSRFRGSVLFSSTAAALISAILLVNGSDRIKLTEAFSGAAFSKPLLLRQPPGDASRFMVVEQDNTIRVVKNGVVQGTPFLDISDRATPGSGEQGLLGFAFDPGYPETPYVYVSYTTKSDGDYARADYDLARGDSVVSRFPLKDIDTTPNLDEVDTGAGKEQVILTASQLEQIDSRWTNHNGGNIEFGPDGLLYFGLGDGGGSGDPEDHGQDTSTFLGSLLRVDVSSLTSEVPPYAIPESNPFSSKTCDQGECPEIYAWGLRNPWRFTFDDFGLDATGDLWLGDVGQGSWEEVNRVDVDEGRNYGWDCREGPAEYGGSSSSDCSPTGDYVDPVAWYVREGFPDDCSVTGGYVYRGTAIPDLVGTYLFADYCSGIIRAVPYYSSPGSPMSVLHRPQGVQITSFGRDLAGELYVTDASSGKIYKITAAP